VLIRDRVNKHFIDARELSADPSNFSAQ